MKLKLYYSSRSCAFAPHILLFDTKADFDAVKIDFNKSEQKSDTYLQVNPKGRVPALLTDLEEYLLKHLQYSYI